MRHEAPYLFSGPFRDVEEIPFPCLAVVRREGLAPPRAIFVPGVPPKDDEDRLAIERVFAEEVADAVFVEGTDYRRIDPACVARDPVKTPEASLGIEQPQGQPFEEFAFQARKLGCRISIHIRRTVQDLRIHVRGIELGPVMAIGEPFVQVPIVHLPFSDKEIEIVRRRIRRGRNLKLAFRVQRNFGSRNTFIRG